MRTILVPVGLSSSLPISPPSDAAAILVAQSLRYHGGQQEIVSVSVGGSCAEEALLAALARGADRAILAETQFDDPRSASLLLASLVRHEKPHLIVFGDRDLEDPACQIAPRLAATLGWPYASGIFEIETAAEKQCRVVRDLDRRRERLELTLPAVLSVGIPESGIPLLSLYDIVAARSKPIKRMKGASLASLPPLGYTVLKSEPVTIQRKNRMVANIDELITALREEAHVI